MDVSGINVADIAVAFVLVASGLLAFLRGFIRETLSIGSWVGAVFVALYAFPLMRPFAKDLIAVDLGADLLAGVGTFVAALVILSIVSQAIAGAVQASSLSALDRSLGFAFGLVRGGVLVCLAYLAIVWLIEEQQRPTWVTEARVLPLVQTGSEMIVALLPAHLQKQMEAAGIAAQKPARRTRPPAVVLSTAESRCGTGHTRIY